MTSLEEILRGVALGVHVQPLPNSSNERMHLSCADIFIARVIACARYALGPQVMQHYLHCQYPNCTWARRTKLSDHTPRCTGTMGTVLLARPACGLTTAARSLRLTTEARVQHKAVKYMTRNRPIKVSYHVYNLAALNDGVCCQAVCICHSFQFE